LEIEKDKVTTILCQEESHCWLTAAAAKESEKDEWLLLCLSSFLFFVYSYLFKDINE